MSCSGYIPPEHYEGKDASEKFDIFSLGVVMIEIISGPEAYKKKVEMSSQDFIEYVRYVLYKSRSLDIYTNF